jgi:hypothetical protein
VNNSEWVTARHSEAISSDLGTCMWEHVTAKRSRHLLRRGREEEGSRGTA